jgi:uncharacterized membrane protein
LSHSLLAASFFLHLVATVIWIGGMALLVLVIYPLQRRADDAESARLLDGIEARFRPLANFSLLVLLVTGVVQTGNDESYGGLLSFDNDWSRAILGKHIAFAGMVLIVGFLQFGLAPALERARLLASRGANQDDVNRLRGRQRRLSQINFALGAVVLAFTAIATAL